MLSPKQTLFILLISLMLISQSFALTTFDTNINLITNNPSFENNYAGWYNAGGVIDSTTASDGNKSGKLDCSSGQQCDWRSNSYRSVTAGKRYLFTFDYKTSVGATDRPQIRLRFHEVGTGVFKGEYQSALPRTNGSWQSVSAIATCPNATCEVDIFFTTNRFGSFTGIAWLDNVALHPEVDVQDLPYIPADGTMGWADELTLRWPANENASAYLVYTGTTFDEVDSAMLTILPADFDLDSKVDLNDFGLLATQWHSSNLPDSGPIADANGDRVIDISDLSSVATYFTLSNEIPAPFQSKSYNSKFNIKLPSTNQDYFWRVDSLISGEIQKGPTLRFNCEDYLDYKLAMPTKIYYLNDTYMSRTQQVTFQSLQGLLARSRPELFLRTDWNALWLNDITNTYQINTYNIAAQAGSTAPLAWTLNRYDSRYTGYIICDAYNDRHSLTAAISLAAAIDGAIVIDISDLSLMNNRNKTLVADVRGKNEKWVWDNYKDNFNKKAIFVQRDDINSHGVRLRDLPIALRALTWWDSDYYNTEDVFSAYRKNIPCYGWDSPVMTGEGGAVRYHSEHSMYTVVTDWSLNLTLYAGMASRQPEFTFTQPCSDNTYSPEDNVHYVSFIISDMDNANVIFDATGWALNANRYASPNRGKFAMGWGMPPAMLKLGPSVMKWWYDRAKETDCFIGYCSGMDYFNPSHFPDLDIHTSHLAKYLKQCDMKTMLIIDGLMPEKTLDQSYYETAKWFTDIDQLEGLFYLEYERYAPYNGKIYWFDGKPMVTARFDFRDQAFYSAVRQTPAALAASINAMPATPDNDNGYTFVTVHAWSRGWNDVAECIKLLDPDVRVITPNEMIEQLYLHNVGGN